MVGEACVLLAAVVPLRIVPNKIVYPVGEKGELKVVVESRGAVRGDADSAELIVEEKWGLEGEGRELWRGQVSLTNGERKTLSVPYPGSTVRYGHEVRVTVNPSSLVPHPSSLNSRSEFFNVNSDWWRVNQGCATETPRDHVTPGLAHLLAYYGFAPTDWGKWQYFSCDSWAQRTPGWGPFTSYNTMATRWQMQKSSVGGNAVVSTYPDGQRWITPNGSMPRDTGLIRRDTRVSHDWGFHHTRFTINLMEGPYGFELARKKPHFMLRNDRGQYQGLYMEAGTDPVKIATPDCAQRYPWTYVEPNFFRADCFEWAIDDLVKCVTELDEDGVYFDGRYMKKQGYDAFGRNLQKTEDVAACVVRNMRRTKEEIFAANPKAYIWSNGASASNPELTLADHPQSGLLHEVQWPFLMNPSRHDHSYRGYLDALLAARDAAWLPGPYVRSPSKIMHSGYLAPSWDLDRLLKGEEGHVMAQHVMSLLASVAAHPFAGGTAMRSFKQMMTRYSELFWHEDIEIMKDGYKRFVADSMREIWYDDMIYRRETPGWVQYTIHLVNTPEQDFCDDLVTADPPAADDVEVSTKLFGADEAKAWVIKPHGWLAETLEPTCTPVAARTINGETVFKIPPFRYYSLLVIKVMK